MAENQAPPAAGTPPAAGVDPNAGAAQKPEGVPDKFWDAATSQVNHKAWGESRTQLEQKLSSYGKDKAKPDAAGALGLPKDEPAPIDDNADVGELVRSIGLDPTVLAEGFLKNNKLTTAEYATFREKKGITRGVVDQFIRMEIKELQAADAEITAAANKLVGGEKQRDTVRAWATQNLSDTDRAFYEKLIAKRDTAVQGFEWLVGKYNGAVGAGKAQPLIIGSGPAPSKPGGFASRKEVNAAQADPRYRADMEYKKSVDLRVVATDDKILFPPM